MMKKLLAMALAMALVMSCGISAFAEIKVDNKKQEGTSVEVESAYIVSANASGDELIVQEDVNNEKQFPPEILARVDASNGAQIEIGDSVLGDGPGINARGNETTVTVGGDVTDTSSVDAIRAFSGAEVTVSGNVTESGDGDAIYAEEGATVIIGGDVSQSDDGNAIEVYNGATVVVEGAVTGFIEAGSSAADCVYIGQLQNGMITTWDGTNVHYLIGLAEDSELTFEDVSMSGDDIVDPSKTIQGLEKSYLYTKTVDGNVLVGKSVTLKPSAEGKALSVSGLDNAKVNCVPNADGTVTLTIQSGFNGGLANLILQLMKDNPELAAAILADNTIYFDAANYDMQTGNITVTGADADAVTAYSQADHAGVTFAASLLKADGANDIRVFNGEEELSSDDFSCHFHRDGSMSLIISNTYLLTGGSGAYSFKALVNGVEAAFDLAVVC